MTKNNHKSRIYFLYSVFTILLAGIYSISLTALAIVLINYGLSNVEENYLIIFGLGIFVFVIIGVWALISEIKFVLLSQKLIKEFVTKYQDFDLETFESEIIWENELFEAIELENEASISLARKKLFQALKSYKKEKMTEIKFSSDVNVELVRSSASDKDVLFAARVSTIGETSLLNAENEATEKDQGLINYLMRDRHGSPFEHNFMTFFVQAPIFVFREFMRHRIASYNEESGRYRELEAHFYIPENNRNIIQTGKPGKYVYTPGSQEQIQLVQEELKKHSISSYNSYQEMLQAGIAREVARMVLPLNLFSSMYVTLNARSLMNFLSLRTINENSKFPSFPQREIEMCAEKMEIFWKDLMPMTHESFQKNGWVAP